MPFFKTSDATQLFYVDGGSGEPVVLVASAWLSSRMWEFQFSHLVAAGHRCVAYDRRGHGRSDWPWTGYDYDTLADDLATLLECLNLRDATLVAHSIGGGEVIRYLSRHGSQRVKRIALIAATLPFPMKTVNNPGGIDPALMEADMAVRTSDRPRWFADNAPAFFGLDLPGVSVSLQFVDFMIGQCLDCSARAATNFFLTGFSTDFRQELKTVTVPSLIIHGTHDVQAPIDICGRPTAQLVPDSRFIQYDNAAHGLFVTHARRLNEDLSAFIGAGRASSEIDFDGESHDASVER